MATEWFYAHGNREFGPVPWEHLRRLVDAGALHPDELVWCTGMPDWKPGIEIPGLFDEPASGSHFAEPLPPAFLPEEVSGRRIAAGICGILVGGLGVHKFVLQKTTAGLIMLLVSLLGGVATCGASWLVMQVIGIVEGVKYLVTPDELFYEQYIAGNRDWF